MKWQRTLLTALCSAALAIPAYAQGGFAGVDANGDGRVSRHEWNRSFARYDQNRNGYIDGDELPAEMRTQTRSRGDAVQRLDRNRSRAVEGYEWPYNKQVFQKLDSDGNSVLTADELRNITSATMIQLDRNNNHRIEPDEWPGGFAQFQELDHNRDGNISQVEYFERGGEWQRRQRFREWDKDRDGFVSSTEWRSRPPLFHQLDTERDGRLSWDEFMAGTQVYNSPFGWR
jgi:Ca2+-binding EF-hand superfamily protein